MTGVAILDVYNVQFNDPSSWTSTTIDDIIIEGSNLNDCVLFPENSSF